MKTCIKIYFQSRVMLIALSCVLAGQLTAQTFKTLHGFSGFPDDGRTPLAALLLSSNILYGTAIQGGSYGGPFGYGTLFAVNTDGTGYTNFYSFTGGSDGALPWGGLVLLGKTLYGTTQKGGTSGNGTVFAVNTDGTGFTNLYSFTGGSDGARPVDALVLSGKTLCGTAESGGSSGNGTVFALNTDGTGFTNLHSFSAGSGSVTNFPPDLTNSDGGSPRAELIISSNTLYGTAYYGGLWGGGTVFKVNTDGTGFTNLHSFMDNAGSNPRGGLILTSNTLYGTTQGGNAANGLFFGNGSVFKVNTDGTGFTNVYSFTELAYGTNIDGASPGSSLIMSGSTLYGTAPSGGRSNYGTLYAVNTDGTDFKVLVDFPPEDGSLDPYGLVLTNNTLFVTACCGGSGGISGNGTVLSISFTPRLAITPSGSDVILAWPTNYAGFDYTGYTLQSTTNLFSPAWATNFPAPAVVGGHYTMTNPTSSDRKFFRLSR